MPPEIARPPADLASPPPTAQRSPSGYASVVLNDGFGTEPGGPEDLYIVHIANWAASGELMETTLEPAGEGPHVCLIDTCLGDEGEILGVMVEGETRRMWFSPEADPSLADVQLLAILRNPPRVPDDVSAIPTGAEVSESGLGSRVLSPGYGTVHPNAGSTVRVMYSGWTSDGRPFDSSVTRRRDGRFRLDRLIEGFSEAVQQMVVGERRRVWIPEDLAYRGHPRAPQGMLVYDIMLLQIVDEP